MVDKITTVCRARMDRHVGRLLATENDAVERLLILFIGPASRTARESATHSRHTQKSSRITTRRRVGRLTTDNPASAKTETVPTSSSSMITSVVVIG